MNLTPDGKQRLAAMKKTLAAGLPLAGMLAAVAAGVAMQGGTSEALAGSFSESEEFRGASPPLHLMPDGHLVTEDGTPIVIVQEKTEGTGEVKIVDRVFPGYLSGGGPSENTTEEQP